MAHLGLRLTRLPWRSFWDAHTPALALAAAAGLLAGGTAVALRGLGAPPLELGFVTLAVTAGGAGLGVWGAPRLFPGPCGARGVAPPRGVLPRPPGPAPRAAP